MAWEVVGDCVQSLSLNGSLSCQLMGCGLKSREILLLFHDSRLVRSFRLCGCLGDEFTSRCKCGQRLLSSTASALRRRSGRVLVSL